MIRRICLVGVVVAGTLLGGPALGRRDALSAGGFQRFSTAWYRVEDRELGTGVSMAAIHVSPNLASLHEVKRIALLFHGTTSRLAPGPEGRFSRFNWHPPRVNFVRTYMRALRDVGEPLDGVVLVQSQGPSWKNFDWKSGKETAQKLTNRLRALFPALRNVILEGHSAGYEPMARTVEAFRRKGGFDRGVAIDAIVLRDAFYGRPYSLLNVVRKSPPGTRLFAFNSTTTTCIAADRTMGPLKGLHSIAAGGQVLVVEHEGPLYRTYMNIPTKTGTRGDTATRHSAVFHPRSPELLQLPYRAMRGDWGATKQPPRLERDKHGAKCFWKRE